MVKGIAKISKNRDLSAGHVARHTPGWKMGKLGADKVKKTCHFNEMLQCSCAFALAQHRSFLYVLHIIMKNFNI